MVDGSIGLVESNSPSLRAYSQFKHSDQAIKDIKFSLDGKLLAAGSKDGNIYIYKINGDKKSFRRHSVCRGHFGEIGKD
jgi:WD40 repeat protein